MNIIRRRPSPLARRPSRSMRETGLRGLAAVMLIALAGTATAQISGDAIRIGFITDLSGSLSDTDGKGGVEAVRMAIENMGGKINEKNIDLLVADHQNRAEIAAARAREWIDMQGLGLLIAGTNSSAALALANLAGASAPVCRGDRYGTLEQFPMLTPDFSSYLLQAQGPKAKILGLATSGDNTINAIKAANEFGLTRTMKLAGMLMYLNEVNTLTLEQAQSMYVSEGWYWDQSEASRAWAQRFPQRTKRLPSSLQATDYSVAFQYLNAVKDIGTDAPDTVIARLKQGTIEDMYAQNGYLRDDGRMVHDMYLYQLKTPAESKGPWDYYKILRTVPGAKEFATKEESTGKGWK